MDLDPGWEAETEGGAAAHGSSDGMDDDMDALMKQMSGLSVLQLAGPAVEGACGPACSHSLLAH